MTRLTNALWWLLVLTLAMLAGSFIPSHDYWRAGVLVVVLACVLGASGEFTETNR